jgi:hypothetical protein
MKSRNEIQSEVFRAEMSMGRERLSICCIYISTKSSQKLYNKVFGLLSPHNSRGSFSIFLLNHPWARERATDSQPNQSTKCCCFSKYRFLVCLPPISIMNRSHKDESDEWKSRQKDEKGREKKISLIFMTL